MSKNVQFEFDMDEVFEGIKQGVIRELSETNFDEAKTSAINQIKSEIKSKIDLTYRDENELKNEVKTEVKNKVFEKLLSDAKKEYNSLYSDYFNGLISKELDKTEIDVKREIKSKTVEKLYDDLYSSIQREMNSKMKDVIAQFVNNIGGNNFKIEDSNNMLTKEEYDELIQRSNKLEALEQGGVDNWEWYGESLNNYFKDECE